MDIKQTVFDRDIIDENTAMLIDIESRSQSPLNHEPNAVESITETTEMNYEEILTGSINDEAKMPGPRKEIFTVCKSRTGKSCQSPAYRVLAKIEKKVTYYNYNCYAGHPNFVPTRAKGDRLFIDYHNQCYANT